MGRRRVAQQGARRQWHARAGAGAVLAMALLTAVVATPAAAGSASFKQVGLLRLPAAESDLRTAVIEPDGSHGYFGTSTSPGRVVKVDLTTFERVGSITLPAGESNLTSAVVEPDGSHAYFGTYTSPGRIIKVDLATFQRVGSITLPAGETHLTSAVIEPDGSHAYFGTGMSPGRVVKVDLATFQRVGSIDLPAVGLSSAVIDPAGAFAYFHGGQVVKVDLATFTSVGSTAAGGGEALAAVIDPAGRHAYFTAGDNEVRLVKVDLETFAQVGMITLGASEGGAWAAMIAPDGRHAYVSAIPHESAFHLHKVDLTSFTKADSLTLQKGGGVRSGVIAPSGSHVYLGTNRAEVVEVRVAPGPAAPPAGFVDVPRNVYFTGPVDWAKATGVTTGVGGTNRFEPLRGVTRAEAVTFLWRARGRSQVSTPHDFVDVPQGVYYEAAVRWAKATGVTTGVGGSTSFEPDRVISRAEAVTFLWRSVGRPPTRPFHLFVDVPHGVYYDEAVRWAKAAGVTTGVGGTNRFEPDRTVDRAQIVTFLFRVYG